MGEDRISELPLHIIHHILCQTDLCTKEAARSCVLSKKWHYFWISRPNVVLNLKPLMPREELVKLVDQSIQPHIVQNFRLKEFSLAFSHQDRRLDLHMDGWIDSVVKLNVEVLKIKYVNFDNTYYILPDVIYTAKELTSLELAMCKFGFHVATAGVLRFHFLENLRLQRVHISDDQLQRIMDSCPFIKNLQLLFCDGLNDLHVFGLVHLQELVVSCELRSMIVEAPNLQFLCTNGGSENYPSPPKFLGGYDTLETLELDDSNITDEQFLDIFSKFSNITDLVLRYCRKLEKIEIRSKKLKKLTISELMNLEQIKIEAPNLMEFVFQGGIVTFSSMDFLGFIQKLYHSKDLIIVIHHKESKAIHIYEVPSQIVIPPSGEVKVVIRPIPKFESVITELVFMQPKIISIIPSAKSKLLEVLHTLLICRNSAKNENLNYVLEKLVNGITVDTNKEGTTFMIEWVDPWSHDSSFF